MIKQNNLNLWSLWQFKSYRRAERRNKIWSSSCCSYEMNLKTCTARSWMLSKTLAQWQRFNSVRIKQYLRTVFTVFISIISNNSSDIYSRIKLLLIELSRIFDGNYNLWIKFRDTFESLMYNNINNTLDITKH